MIASEFPPVFNAMELSRGRTTSGSGWMMSRGPRVHLYNPQSVSESGICDNMLRSLLGAVIRSVRGPSQWWEQPCNWRTFRNHRVSVVKSIWDNSHSFREGESLGKRRRVVLGFERQTQYTSRRGAGCCKSSSKTGS